MHDLDLVVVGGGIAGAAAALRAAQYHMRLAWVLGDADTAKRSRARWVVNIDNMIGIHETLVRAKLRDGLVRAGEIAAAAALEKVPHQHIGTQDIVDDTIERVLDNYPEGVEVVAARASSVRREGETFVVHAGDLELRAPAVVLATGVMDRQPMIKRAKGEEVLDDPKWIYPFANRETVLYCIRCEGHLTADSCAAVIGAGETAAQLSVMLHERYGSACAILTNGETPGWGDDVGALLERYGIPVHTARIVDITGKKGQLHRIELEDGTELGLQFALVALGLYRVYNDLARELGAELADPDAPVEERHVLIDANGETSVHGLFAIGDMATRADEVVMKQVYTAQEYAVRAVDTVDRRRRAARR